MSEINTEKEKKEKKISPYIGNMYIYAIDNGKISKINYSDIKEYDYILEYEKGNDNLIIIDRDKRKIRPFVEDLLSTMDIETKQVKLIKTQTILIFSLLFLSIFSFYFSYSAKNETKKLNDQFKTIQKVQIMEIQKNIIPNL